MDTKRTEHRRHAYRLAQQRLRVSAARREEKIVKKAREKEEREFEAKKITMMEAVCRLLARVDPKTSWSTELVFLLIFTLTLFVFVFWLLSW